MISKKDFSLWFNSKFWGAFQHKPFPIKLPTTPDEKRTVIDRVYERIQTARYSVEIPEAEIVMNKGFGVARTIPVFSIEDYCVYYFCIKELEDTLCINRTPNTFGGWSLGGKHRAQEVLEIESDQTDYGRYSFDPKAWVNAFGEFNSILFSQLEKGNYSHVIQFDLSNFYDSVRLDVLERWIREKTNEKKGWIIALLFYMLNNWNRKNTGLYPQIVGLPQDALADCSRILANFYLQRYDAFAAKVSTNINGMYLRYSDDQMILINCPEKIDNILLLLTRELDKYGLRINQKKVAIWKATELQNHRFQKIQSIFPNKNARDNPELVEKFVREYLKISIRNLKQSWNNGYPLLNRLVWSKLEQVPQNYGKIVYARLTDEAYLLLADSNRLKRIYELSTHFSSNEKIIKKLIKLSRTTVHNAFHYECAKFAKDKQLSELYDLLTKRIESLNEQMKHHKIS